MKRTLIPLIVMAAAAIASVSCNKEEPVAPDVQEGGIPFEFYAKGISSKTTNSGLKTFWSAGDQVNLFHADANSTTYIPDGAFTTATAGESVTFTGELASALTNGSDYDWYAIYPYNKNITTPANTGDKGYVTVGSSKSGHQTQTGNSNKDHIAGTNYPIAGAVEDVTAPTTPSITMSHLTTLMAVNVKNGTTSPITVSEISFTGTEDIVGTYYINFVSDPVVYTKSGESYVGNKATLQVSGGTDIAANATATFYLAVKPFTAPASGTLTIDVTANNGTQSRSKVLASATSFVAGKINTLNFTYDKSAPSALPEVDIASTPYMVGFEEAEGFTASATYNNTVEKQDGAVDREWNILSGSVSTTGAITGSNCMLIRDYSGNSFAPYVSTAFKLSSLKYVTFKAKTSKVAYGLQIYYSTDNGASWTAGDTFVLTTTPALYSTTFASNLSGAAIKFVITQPGSRDSNETVYIDDVEFHSTVPAASVVPNTVAATSYQNTATGETATLNGTFTLNYGAAIGDVSEYGFKYKIGDGAYNTIAGTISSTNVNVVTISKDVTGLTKDTQVTYYTYVVYGGNTIDATTMTFTPTKSAVALKTATFTFANMGYSNQADVSDVSKDDDNNTDITLTFAQNTGSNGPKYYNTGTGVRTYTGNTILVSGGTKTITSIELTFSGSSYTGTLNTGSVGSYSVSGAKGSWSGSANSVTFNQTAGTTRIQKIVVTYSD